VRADVLEEERLGWMALTLTPGMGPTRIARAVARLGGAGRMFGASLTELEGTGMPAAVRRSTRCSGWRRRAERL